MKCLLFSITLVVAAAIVPSRFEDVRSSYLSDVDDLIEEHESKLYKLRQKYVDIAERELRRAMVNRKLDAANDWDAWIVELQAATRKRGSDITSYAEFNEPLYKPRTIKWLHDSMVPPALNADDRRFWFPCHNNGKVAWWFEARWDRVIVLTGMSFVCPNKLKTFPVGGHMPTRYQITAYRYGRAVRKFIFDHHPYAKEIRDGTGLDVDIPLPSTKCDKVKFQVLDVNGNQDGPILWEAKFYGRR